MKLLADFSTRVRYFSGVFNMKFRDRRGKLAQISSFVAFLAAAFAGQSGLAQPISLHAPLTVTIPGENFPAISAAAPKPAPLAVADFNGDGNPDAAIALNDASGNASSVFVLIGKGDGTFQPPKTFDAANTAAICLATADVNSDGKMDLIVSGSAGLSVLLGNGDGTFQTAIQSAGGGCPLAVADFDRDGKPDAAWISSTSGGTSQVGIQLGSGDGHFANASWTISVNAAALVVGDFNEDGKPDLAVSLMNPETGMIGVLLGNGDGTFSVIHKYGVAVPVLNDITQFAGGIAAADFNQDGHVDLAVAAGYAFRTDQGTIYTFRGNGDGTFQTWHAIPGGSASFLTAGDLNGDGKPDLIAGESYLVGIGDGTFQPAVFLAQPDFSCSPGTFHDYCYYSNLGAFIADFNKDGLPDIAVVTMQGASDQPPSLTYSCSVFLRGTGVPPFAATGVSAATFQEPVTIGSLATAFGSGFTQGIAAASGTPWPTVLGGIELQLRDFAGRLHLAPLLYVSPNQINYQVPPDIADGVASIAVAPVGSPAVESGQAINISWDGAASFFTLNQHGLAAATAVRVHPDGKQTPVSTAACSGAEGCTPVPIDVTGDPVYLSLYGTGFETANLLDVILYCSIKNQPASVVDFVGPQGQYPGLDQVNLRLASSLAGSGDSVISCYFTGGPSEAINQVHVTIK